MRTVKRRTSVTTRSLMTPWRKEGDDDSEEASDKEEDEVKVGDDPRAGSIHSVIPLLSVNYMKLSEKMLLQL